MTWKFEEVFGVISWWIPILQLKRPTKTWQHAKLMSHFKQPVRNFLLINSGLSSWKLEILYYSLWLGSKRFPGVFDVNGICVPRLPRPQQQEFYEAGGYPILQEHANARFFLAGHGTRGYATLTDKWSGLSNQDYKTIQEVHYVHPARGPETNYNKLRQIEVRNVIGSHLPT